MTERTERCRAQPITVAVAIGASCGILAAADAHAQSRRFRAADVFLAPHVIAPQRSAQVHDEARARIEFDRGVGFAEALQWNLAVEAFEASYAAMPRRATLRNLALAHRALDHYTRAIELLERYLASAEAPSELDADVRTVIDEMRASMATLTVNVAPVVPGARVTVDGRPAQIGVPMTVDPGDHVISAAAAHYATHAETISLARRARRQLDVRLAATGGGIGTRWWFWTGLGAVAAAGVAVTLVLVQPERSPDCGTTNACVMP